MTVLEDRVGDSDSRQTRRVFEIDPLQDPRWRAFVERHPDASVFHRVEWLRALNSCYGYIPRAITLSSPDSPLENGLVFCEIRSTLTGKRLVSLPFSDHSEPLATSSDEINFLVASLAAKVDDEKWNYVEVRSIIRTPSGDGRLAISETYYFHQLDLRPSEQALLKSFHKDCVQRKIRRAERECLRYEQGRSESLLKNFYKLLIMSRRRQGLPPQPLKWFRALIASMGQDVQIRVAFKGEIPVASILTVTNKRTLVYKYGCSNSRFNNLGGTPLLFWRAIQEARTNGFEQLDMGRSDTDNIGLVTFKEHWGAERSTINYWRYPARPARSRAERCVGYTKRLVSIAPDWSLVMLGNLLYRHMA